MERARPARRSGADRAPALRVFFDASSFQDLESRGWLIAGQQAPC